MKLYCLPGACSLADHILLAWIGQPYEIEILTRDALKSPAYLAINPAGAVPTLVEDDGWVLTENVAILNYLADLHPEAGLAGDGSIRGRAQVNRWLGYLNSDVHKSFVPLFAPVRFNADESSHEGIRQQARRNVRAHLERIDAHLAGRQWLAADTRSLADPYLFVMLGWTGRVGVDRSDRANLTAFETRMRADAGVQRALAAEGLA